MSEALRAAARRLAQALDLPGEGADDVARARLRTIANVDAQGDAVIAADAALRAELERDPIPAWLHPDADDTARWIALAMSFPSLRNEPAVLACDMRALAA